MLWLMSNLGRWLALAFTGAAILAAGPSSADDFYKGKTINIMVGFGPGGGYDLYARLLARHLGNTFRARPTSSCKTWKGRAADAQPITSTARRRRMAP